MPLRSACGFESGSLSAYTQGGGDALAAVSAGNIALDTVTVRTGTYSLLVNPTGTGTGAVRIGTFSPTGTAGSSGLAIATAYYGFAFRFEATSGAFPVATGDEPFCNVVDTSTNLKIEFRINNAGKILAYRTDGTTLIATGTTVLSPDTWYYIEIMAGTGASSVPWELMINGVSEISGAHSIGNVVNGGLNLGKMVNRNGNSVIFYYDDAYIADTTYLGFHDLRVLRFAPNVNGSTMQWTGGTNASDYQEVDEVVPSSADYIQSTAANQVALMGFQSCAEAGISGAVAIHGVQFHGNVAEVTGGASEVHTRIRSNSVNSDGDVDTSVTSTLIVLRGKYAAVDPSGGGAWTTARVDAVEAGFVETAASAVRLRSRWMALMVAYSPTGTFTSAIGQTGALGGTTFDASIGSKLAKSLALYNEAGSLLASTPGFYWFFIDRARPIEDDVIVDAGGPVSTDAGGVITATLANSNLAVGQTGYLFITQTDGDPSQSPSPRAWQMPVIISTGA